MSEINVNISQSVAILIDGNNMELSIHAMVKDQNAMLNFDVLIPKLLDNRSLNRLIYFREGVSISNKLAERLHRNYHGSVIPCHKSADIPLTIKATQIASKVDTVIILSGDSDYVELVRHLRGSGVRVEIAAIEATTAAILKEEADFFIEITEEDVFSYGGRTNARRSSGQKSTPKAEDKSNKKTNSSSNQKSTGNSGKSNSNSGKSAGNTAKSQDSKNSSSGRSKTVTVKAESSKSTPARKTNSRSGTRKTTRKSTRSKTQTTPKTKS